MITDPYFGYIASAYGIVAFVIVVMIAGIFWQHKSRLTRLAELESKGIKRRSAKD